MNDMTLFLDLILLASGVYCMYTWLRLAVTKHLFKNGLLVPKEKKISDCADEAEYIRYMTPPLAVMAILTLAYGVIMLLNDQLSEPFLPYLWSLVPLVVVLASLVRRPQRTRQPGLFRDVTPHLAPLPGELSAVG